MRLAPAVQRVLAAIPTGQAARPRDVRDRSLVLLVRALTRAEIVALDVAHVDPARRALSVLRRGTRTRTSVRLDDATAEALAAHLAVRGPGAGPVFVRDRNDRFARDRLTPGGVNEVLEPLGAAAGVAGFRPDAIRRRRRARDGPVMAA